MNSPSVYSDKWMISTEHKSKNRVAVVMPVNNKLASLQPTHQQAAGSSRQRRRILHCKHFTNMQHMNRHIRDGKELTQTNQTRTQVLPRTKQNLNPNVTVLTQFFTKWNCEYIHTHTCNRWPSCKHVSNSTDEKIRTKPKPTFTELDPNMDLIFFKVLRTEQTQTHHQRNRTKREPKILGSFPSLKCIHIDTCTYSCVYSALSPLADTQTHAHTAVSTLYSALSPLADTQTHAHTAVSTVLWVHWLIHIDTCTYSCVYSALSPLADTHRHMHIQLCLQCFESTGWYTDTCTYSCVYSALSPLADWLQQSPKVSSGRPLGDPPNPWRPWEKLFKQITSVHVCTCVHDNNNYTQMHTQTIIFCSTNLFFQSLWVRQVI